jgi:hypothetical protein
MKLYPPYIEGKIPAFVKDIEEETSASVKEPTIKLTVPF